MGKKLFGNNIEPACEYCVKGKMSDDGMVYCPQMGVVHPYFSCKWFSYSPLKRVPRRAPSLPSFKAEDFSLDD